MSNRYEIARYLAQELKKGASKEFLLRALVEGGWPPTEVISAFSMINEVREEDLKVEISIPKLYKNSPVSDVLGTVKKKSLFGFSKSIYNQPTGLGKFIHRLYVSISILIICAFLIVLYTALINPPDKLIWSRTINATDEIKSFAWKGNFNLNILSTTSKMKSDYLIDKDILPYTKDKIGSIDIEGRGLFDSKNYENINYESGYKIKGAVFDKVLEIDFSHIEGADYIKMSSVPSFLNKSNAFDYWIELNKSGTSSKRVVDTINDYSNLFLDIFTKTDAFVFGERLSTKGLNLDKYFKYNFSLNGEYVFARGASSNLKIKDIFSIIPNGYIIIDRLTYRPIEISLSGTFKTLADGQDMNFDLSLNIYNINKLQKIYKPIIAE